MIFPLQSFSDYYDNGYYMDPGSELQQQKLLLRQPDDKFDYFPSKFDAYPIMFDDEGFYRHSQTNQYNDVIIPSRSDLAGGFRGQQATVTERDVIKEGIKRL